jgi:hypothetical protein
MHEDFFALPSKKVNLDFNIPTAFVSQQGAYLVSMTDNRKRFCETERQLGASSRILRENQEGNRKCYM